MFKNKNQNNGFQSEAALFDRSALTPVELPIYIYCHAGKKTPIYDQGKTIAIGAAGAVVALRVPVVVDELVLINLPRSGEERLCRVTAVASSDSAVHEVGLEFLEESPEFWDIERLRQEQESTARETQEISIAEARTMLAQRSQVLSELTSAIESDATAGLIESLEMATSGQGAEQDLFAPPVAVSKGDRRRGPRLHLETRVLVSFPGEAFPRECRTSQVGVAGALLLLPQTIGVGQSLILTNPISLNQVVCQVRWVKQESYLVIQAGVQFLKEAQKFWGVTFPPIKSESASQDGFAVRAS